MNKSHFKIVAALATVAVVAILTNVVVSHLRRPGQLDVVSAQAMDMSSMRPPTGAAPVQLATVKSGSIGDTVTYTGSVLAYNQQEIAPRITGTVVSLPVYPGGKVQAGQLVAQLDSDEIRARVSEAAAAAQEAQNAELASRVTNQVHHHAALEQASSLASVASAQVSDAAAELEAAQSGVGDAQSYVRSAQASDDYWNTEIAREKSLLGQGAISQQEYDNEFSQAQAASAAVTSATIKVRQAVSMLAASRAKLDAARNQAAAAQSAVDMARADMSSGQAETDQAEDAALASNAALREARVVAGYARITAPVSGVVTTRPVAPGTLVAPGTVLLTIAQIDRVRIQAHVAVNDLAGIRVGSPVTIDAAGSGLPPFNAAVTSVFPSANDQTRTAVVEAIVSNPAQRLLPGEFVSVRITRSVASDKLLVPASAVISDGGATFVWVARGAQAAAHRVDVEIGARSGVLTEVDSNGLAAGDRVVTRGQAGLTEGAAVAETSWGPDGPRSLPTASQVSRASAIYRCEKCGMTYSASDAAKYHYVDPMDGGKLVEVKTAQGQGQ